MMHGKGNGYAQTPYHGQDINVVHFNHCITMDTQHTGTLPAYTTRLAWSLPYAQGIHSLIHSNGYE